MSHPIDFALEALPNHKVQLMLEPVLCMDCEQYVPLGWVEFGTQHCPQATGHYRGHRALNEAITSIKDRLYNTLAEAGLLPKRGSVEIVRLVNQRGYGFVLSNDITGQIVEASSVNLYGTRAKAVDQARDRASALGFEIAPIDDKTSRFESVDAFLQRIRSI